MCLEEVTEATKNFSISDLQIWTRGRLEYEAEVVPTKTAWECESWTVRLGIGTSDENGDESSVSFKRGKISWLAERLFSSSAGILPCAVRKLSPSRYLATYFFSNAAFVSTPDVCAVCLNNMI
jgi:hypothetical protein